MKIRYKFIFFTIILSWLQILIAQDHFVFDNVSQQVQFEKLIKECRCITCPNQNIAESYAPIAKAIEEEIYQRVKQHQSPENIRAYLQSKYGDYVLYKPQIKKSTWILWLGPFGMILIGLGLWLKIFNA